MQLVLVFQKLPLIRKVRLNPWLISWELNRVAKSRDIAKLFKLDIICSFFSLLKLFKQNREKNTVLFSLCRKCSGDENLHPINYCCKALHLRCWQGRGPSYTSGADQLNSNIE